jgi:hypothetical protein
MIAVLCTSQKRSSSTFDRRFVQEMGKGDIDRDRVVEARKTLN